MRKYFALTATGFLLLGLASPTYAQDVRVAARVAPIPFDAGQIAKSGAKSAARAATKAATKSIVKAAAKASVKSAAKSAAKAAAKTAAKTVAKSAAKEAAKLASKEAANAAIKIAQKEAAKGSAGSAISGSKFSSFGAMLTVNSVTIGLTFDNGGFAADSGPADFGSAFSGGAVLVGANAVK